MNMKYNTFALLVSLPISIPAIADGTKTEFSAAIEAASTRLISISDVKFSKDLMCPSSLSCKKFLVTGKTSGRAEAVQTLTVQTITSTKRPGPVKANIINKNGSIDGSLI
jgi:hypothetical protein